MYEKTNTHTHTHTHTSQALSFSVPIIERIVGEELAEMREKEERERRKALEVEEFRRQALELMEGTVGAALSEEQDGGGWGGSSGNNMQVETQTHTHTHTTGHGVVPPQGSPVAGLKRGRRRRRTASMYRRPRYLVFGCRDTVRVEMDAYGEPLAEGECVDMSRTHAQESRGLMQGLATAGGPASGGGGGGGQVQRWGYLDDTLMTEAEAQARIGTNALKFVMKESMVEVRWKVKVFHMEGRTDGKNLRAVLTNLAPRRVIFVHGTDESYGDLKRYASKMLGGTTEVWVPGKGEEKEKETEEGGEGGEGGIGHSSSMMVKLQFDTKVLDVGLEEPEAGGGYGQEGGGWGVYPPPVLALKEMGHYRLALVRAVASAESKDADGKPLVRCEPALAVAAGVAASGGGGEGGGIEEEGEEGEGGGGERDEGRIDNADLMTTAGLAQTRQPFLLADGDVLLTETSQRQSLRQKLREAGVNPEFQVGPEGASLICDGTTIVRVKDNRVTLEGPLSETYFRVRNAIYSRFVAL